MGWRRIIAFVLVAILALQPLATGQSVFAATNQQDTNDTYQNGDDTYITEDDTTLQPDVDGSIMGPMPAPPMLAIPYDSGCGHFALVMPEDTAETYTVTLNITATLTGDPVTGMAQPATYTANLNGTEQPVIFAVGIHPYDKLIATIPEVQGGTTLTIMNIAQAGLMSGYYAYDTAYIDAQVVSEGGVVATLSSDERSQIAAEQTASIVATAGEGEATQGEYNPITTDTFLSLDGEYSLSYLLNHYNIISFDDIEATHIIGPIIAQNSGYYTNRTDSLKASDYSRGVSSYVGHITARPSTTVGGYSYGSEFAFNYDYDHKYSTTFERPHFYTKETYDGGTLVVSEIELYSAPFNEIVLTVGGVETKLPTPSAGGQVLNYEWASGQPTANLLPGKSYTYQNDDFIDFDKLQKAMIAASQNLGQTGSLEGKTPVIEIDATGKTQVDLPAGYSYSIRNADSLQAVNYKVPEGHDFFTNPYPIPTVVTFEDDVINQGSYGGYQVSRLPQIYLNGQEIKQPPQGAGSEFDEIGNKLIWNFPNVVTSGDTNRLVPFNASPVIIGHIVAPQAEFWNIIESGTWGGGDFNGTGIFADFHSGTTESHLWPYGGLYEKSTSVKLEAEKNLVGGTLQDEQFSFALSIAADSAVDGLIGAERFPYTLTNSQTGKIEIPELIFEEDGIYKFDIVEMQPENADPSIVYDHAEYQIVIKVTSVDATDKFGKPYKKFKTSTTIYKDGEEQSGAPNIAFTNQQLAGGSVAATIDATKKLVSEAGAELALQLGQFTFELVLPDAVQPPVDGLETILPLRATNHDDGTVTFPDLVFSKVGDYLFILKEVVPTPSDDGIIYDSSTYEITVSVTDAGDNVLKTAVSYTKDGVTVEKPQVVFTNTKTVVQEETEFSFTKVDAEDDTILLPGAEFTLISSNPAQDDTLWQSDDRVVATSSAVAGSIGEVFFGNLAYDVVSGGNYYFKETKAPEGYALPAGYWEIDIDVDGSITIHAHRGAPELNGGKIPNEKTHEVYTNVYFKKQDQFGKPLKNAQFKVEQVESMTNLETVVTDGITATASSDINGNFAIEGLLVGGVYRMTEVVAPSGCFLPTEDNYWVIEALASAGESNDYTVKVHMVRDGNLVLSEDTLGRDDSYIVINYSKVDLPTTGGMGTTWFAIIGLFMLCAAGLLFNTVRKTERKKWR